MAIQRPERERNTTMGIAIQCILAPDLPGIPLLEGKSLAMAYCSDPSVEGDDGLGGGEDGSDGADIIAVDFGGPRSSGPPVAPASTEPLFAALDPFMAGEAGVNWHDPSEGLIAVRAILAKLRGGTTIRLDPDFEDGSEIDEDFTAGVIFDLETLEEILGAAQAGGARFYLGFDV